MKRPLVLMLSIAALCFAASVNLPTRPFGSPPGLLDLNEELKNIKPIVENGRTIWSYKLRIKEAEFNLINNIPYKVFAYNGQVPGPLIVAREGDWVRIKLINDTSVNHSIHSHGLFVPQRMDGVPHEHGMTRVDHAAMNMDASMPAPTAMPGAVGPGDTFTYEYIARPAGTHWYHCHVSTNEHLNRGMAGPLVVLPRIAEPSVDHDFVLLLQEWNSKYAQQGTPGNPREVNDADYFTINGLSFPETPRLQMALGSVNRFRIINAGSQMHPIHIHGHTFLVTHMDGAPLTEPIDMDTVPVAPGGRVDFLLVANNPGDWPLHSHIVAQQTNGGQYPGGMMMHLLVGNEERPETGDGPIGEGTASLRDVWRASAKAQQNASSNTMMGRK